MPGTERLARLLEMTTRTPGVRTRTPEAIKGFSSLERTNASLVRLTTAMNPSFVLTIDVSRLYHVIQCYQPLKLSCCALYLLCFD